MADTLAPSAPEGTSTTPRVRRPGERWRPSRQGTIARLAVLALVVGFVLAAPLMVPSVQINIVSRIAVFAIVALSLNILVGYTGQISLGHSAFLGFGAFATGFVITELGLPWAAALGAAVVIGSLAAVILGFIALRVKGLYLALVTLAFGLFAERVVFNITAITRGGAGMPADRPEWAFEDLTYAYVCIAALALIWLLDWRLTSSRAGRSIQALRDSEKVAASWGINVTNYKLLAFVLSGAIAGLAGGLFASIEQLVSPITFNFQLSLLFLLMVVIGGAGSRPGVVLGAILLESTSFFLDLVADANPGFPVDGSAGPLVGAILLLAVLLRYPGGIAQLLNGPFRWLSFKQFKGRMRDSAPTGGGADVRP
jgi:branched-chain amino acid transport system permease protein